MTQFSQAIIADLIVGTLTANELDIDNTNLNGQDRGRIHAYFDSVNLEHEIDFFIGAANILAGWGAPLTESQPANMKNDISSAFGNANFRITSGSLNSSSRTVMTLAGGDGDGTRDPEVRFASTGGAVADGSIFRIGSIFHKLIVEGIASSNKGWIESSAMRPVQNSVVSSIAVGGSVTYVATSSGALAFIAPASGVVRIDHAHQLRIQMSANGSRSIFASVEVRTGATIGGGSVVQAFSDDHAVTVAAGNLSGALGQMTASNYLIVSGLTPGNSYHIRFGHRVGATTNLSFADTLSRRVAITAQM